MTHGETGRDGGCLGTAYSERAADCRRAALHAARPFQDLRLSAGAEPGQALCPDVAGAGAGRVAGKRSAACSSPSASSRGSSRSSSRAKWLSPTSWPMRRAPSFPYANGGEGAVLYCFVFLYLAFAGGGVWALDRMRKWIGSRCRPGASRPELHQSLLLPSSTNACSWLLRFAETRRPVRWPPPLDNRRDPAHLDTNGAAEHHRELVPSPSLAGLRPPSLRAKLIRCLPGYERLRVPGALRRSFSPQKFSLRSRTNPVHSSPDRPFAPLRRL